MKSTEIPFTCAISKKYCGSEINNILIEIERVPSLEPYQPLCNIPISNEVLEMIEWRDLAQIRNSVIGAIKECVKRKK